MSPKVAILILNWNGWKDTIECLESLQHLTYPNYQVVLVDNGSTNNSVEKIRDWCKGKISVETNFVEFKPKLKPVSFLEYAKKEAESGGDISREISLDINPSNKKLIIIQTGENLGFTGGNNVALRYCLKKDHKYLWLLNNDTVVDKDSLKEMIQVAESDASIGVMGPMVLNYNQPQYISSIGLYVSQIGKRAKLIGRMENRGEPAFNTTRDVEGISGCALLICQETVRKIGLLDERYYLYMEDVDWCTRAIQHHFRCVYVPKAEIWHKGWESVEGSIGLSDYYLARSQLLYLKKNSFGVRYFFDVLAFCFLSLFLLVRSNLSGGNLITSRAHIKGLIHGLLGNYSYRWRPKRTM